MDQVSEAYDNCGFNKFNLKDLNIGLETEGILGISELDIALFIRDCMNMVYEDKYIVQQSEGLVNSNTGSGFIKMYGLMSVKTAEDLARIKRNRTNERLNGTWNQTVSKNKMKKISDHSIGKPYDEKEFKTVADHLKELNKKNETQEDTSNKIKGFKQVIRKGFSRKRNDRIKKRKQTFFMLRFTRYIEDIIFKWLQQRRSE